MAYISPRNNNRSSTGTGSSNRGNGNGGGNLVDFAKQKVERKIMKRLSNSSEPSPTQPYRDYPEKEKSEIWHRRMVYSVFAILGGIAILFFFGLIVGFIAPHNPIVKFITVIGWILTIGGGFCLFFSWIRGAMLSYKNYKRERARDDEDGFYEDPEDTKEASELDLLD